MEGFAGSRGKGEADRLKPVITPSLRGLVPLEYFHNDPIYHQHAVRRPVDGTEGPVPQSTIPEYHKGRN